MIFINGNHFGTSGQAYWRQTIAEQRLVSTTFSGTSSLGIPSYHQKYETTFSQQNFDELVMAQLQDRNARYYDGA